MKPKPEGNRAESLDLEYDHDPHCWLHNLIGNWQHKWCSQQVQPIDIGKWGRPYTGNSTPFETADSGFYYMHIPSVHKYWRQFFISAHQDASPRRAVSLQPQIDILSRLIITHGPCSHPIVKASVEQIFYTSTSANQILYSIVLPAPKYQNWTVYEDSFQQIRAFCISILAVNF